MVRFTVHQRGSFLKDVVFSASDGIVTTFAIVTGSIGASLPTHVVLILGFANLFADGVSMAAGNYIGTKSETEYEKSKGDKNKEGAPFLHAIVTYISFCLAGFVPLIPYVFRLEPYVPLSILLVGSTLFFVGSIRSKMIGTNIFKGGLEMMVVGGFAASVAFVVGYFLQDYNG
jgi:VIT1/CCC1 family predicted Fe2+/Mn2+ transporter